MPTSLYLLCFHAMILFFLFFSSFSSCGWSGWDLDAGCGKGDLVISRNGLFRTGVDSLVRWLTVLSTLLSFPFFFFSLFFFPPQLLSSCSALPPSLPPSLLFRSIVKVPLPCRLIRAIPISRCHYLEYDSLAVQLNFNQPMIVRIQYQGGVFIQDRNCLQANPN